MAGQSNDNLYSESAFKTLKYCPVFPGSFAGIDEARAFCRLFFPYYNTAIPGSASTPRKPCTTDRPGKSASAARKSSTRHSRPARTGSAADGP